MQEFCYDIFPRKWIRRVAFVIYQTELGEIVKSLSSSVGWSLFRELTNQFYKERYRIFSDFIEAFMMWSEQIF